MGICALRRGGALLRGGVGDVGLVVGACVTSGLDLGLYLLEWATGAGTGATDRPCRRAAVRARTLGVVWRSEKENACATWKKGFGFHPLWAFADHGPGGSGEPLAVLLRPGNAGSNMAADDITVASAALAQLPRRLARSRAVLVRADSGGAHAFLPWLHQRRLSYSVGFTLGSAAGSGSHRSARRSSSAGIVVYSSSSRLSRCGSNGPWRRR